MANSAEAEAIPKMAEFGRTEASVKLYVWQKAVIQQQVIVQRQTVVRQQADLFLPSDICINTILSLDWF